MKVSRRKLQLCSHLKIAQFLPKFHCELNQIEQYWMHGKREYKDRNMMVESTEKFGQNVDICLNKIDKTLAHKCAKHARKYLNAYYDNKSTREAVELVKQMAKVHKRHRDASRVSLT